MIPKMIVLIADQRNQKSAAGVMYLPSAGLSSSGILGVVGVETKLKYQSNPIHITPEITCSQRSKNGPNGAPSVPPLSSKKMMKTTSASTKPVITALRRFDRNAAMS